MKKYSKNYFEDKFNVLYKRLLNREGFFDDVDKLRQELKIPKGGFSSEIEFSFYLMERLTKKEKEEATSLCFLFSYEREQGKMVDLDNKEEKKKLEKEFDKRYKNDFDPVLVMTYYQMRLDDHNNFYTKDPFISHGKKNLELFNKVKKLFDKYMGIDLLDAHIVMQFVEKYIFLGDKGVKDYIRRKSLCSMCRYVGVNHFSPERKDMKGKDLGPFSGKYLFNDGFVKLISNYFDSVFLVIRPFATKKEVIQYIDDNWNELKEHMTEKNTFYKQLDIGSSRIRESDTEKNKLIYELYKLGKKDLVKMYKGNKDLSLSGIYKESIISAILDDEHGIKMSPDAIKKSATRFSKSKKKSREPKDIGDI